MNQITRIIKQTMEDKQVTPYQIEKGTGINHSAVSRMLRGKDLRCDTAAKIIEYLQSVNTGAEYE